MSYRCTDPRRRQAQPCSGQARLAAPRVRPLALPVIPPTSPNPRRPALLVVELWGLGDVALAIPFLRAASRHAAATLLAKPHAGPLLARFAPEVEHVPLVAPWTAFRGKYRLHRWPWSGLHRTIRGLRDRHFDLGMSARHDPRDHLLLALAAVRRRLGFPRCGSKLFLTEALPTPTRLHRAEHWRALAATQGWTIDSPVDRAATGRRIVIHPGAGNPVRVWPIERFRALSERLRARGWNIEWSDPESDDLDALCVQLAGADRFIGNDSGPGHMAALLGVPTFTIFGSQLPELFAPDHPRAAWIEGTPCAYKPCSDYCRFAEPHCIRSLTVDAVWPPVAAWLDA